MKLQLCRSGGYTWFDVLVNGTKVGCFMEERWECENSDNRTYVEWHYEGEPAMKAAAFDLLSTHNVYLRDR